MVVGKRQFEGHYFQHSLHVRCEVRVELWRGKEMGHGDGSAEVAVFVVENLSGSNVDVEDAEFLKLDSILENLARELRVEVVPTTKAKLLDKAADRWLSAILTQEARTAIVVVGIVDISVKSDVQMAKFGHQAVFVCLIQQHVAETLDGQILVARFLQAAIGATFATKGLRVLVESSQSFELDSSVPGSRTQPVVVIRKSKLLCKLVLSWQPDRMEFISVSVAHTSFNA